MSDDSSASKHDVVGFVNTDSVEVTIIDASSGDDKSTSSAVDGSFSFDDLDSEIIWYDILRQGIFHT